MKAGAVKVDHAELEEKVKVVGVVLPVLPYGQVVEGVGHRLAVAFGLVLGVGPLLAVHLVGVEVIHPKCI